MSQNMENAGNPTTIINFNLKESNQNIIAGRDVNIKEVFIPRVCQFIQIDAPTPYFTGRKALVELIHSRLRDCSNKESYADRIVVLHGMGGIGKSELARMYVNTYIKDSIITNVAWVDAETQDSLEESFSSLANQLGLRTDSQSVYQLVQNVYRHFSNHVGSGLFIFDNAPQMNQTGTEFGIFNFLPVQLLKRPPLVLITSRDSEWQGISEVNSIKIDELSDQESVEFLMEALRLTDDQRKNENEISSVKSLANTLQGYPLGLTLATSNIRNSKWTAIGPKIKTYIKRIDVPKGNWTHDKLSTGAATKYKLIMSNVWSASLAQIASFQKEGTDALKLLNLMAFLPPDRISVEKVSEIFAVAFKTACDQESFVLLEKYSLIHVIPNSDKDGNRIRIHRLVQLCTRDRLDCENDLSYLFAMCNYIIRQRRRFQVRRDRYCVHAHLKQRNWPEGSIKYSIIFCSLDLYDGWHFILDAKSFLDSSNSLDEAENISTLYHLCLGFYFTDSKYSNHKVFSNPCIKRDLSKVLVLFAKDYLRHLCAGSTNNVHDIETTSHLVQLKCNYVCYKILLWNFYSLKKDFLDQVNVLDYLITNMNASTSRSPELDTVNEVFRLLWKHSGEKDPGSVVMVIKSVVQKHKQLYPTLLSKSESQLYWSGGGPFSYRSIWLRLGLDEYAKWTESFLDTLFVEGGPQILSHHLKFLSTFCDVKDSQQSEYLFALMIKLACDWKCRSQLIQDADLMESFLLYSIKLFSLPSKDTEDGKKGGTCIITWFSLFQHNKTVSDCRGRPWSINDMTNNISLPIEPSFTHRVRLSNFFRKEIFQDFLKATQGLPENIATTLAKEVVS